MYDLVDLEKAGIPTVDIATDEFHGEAVFRATGLGIPDLAFVQVPAAISQADIDTVNAMADAILVDVVYGLTRPAAAVAVERTGDPKTFNITVDKGGDLLEEWFSFAMDRRWSDGFPVVPPTEERIQWMLTGTSRDPDELICGVPPFYGAATARKVAINAVMAGAKPEYLEAIIAGIDALSDDEVHYSGAIATTDPGNAQMIIINGPIVNELGLNSGWSAMGPGFRPNSAIGRGISLSVRNIGGADTPGAYSQHTYFLPAEYSRVLAQSYPETPGNWKPLSEQLGYRRDQNVIWAMPADVPINCSPFDSPTQPISAENLLRNWVDQMAEQSPRRDFEGIINFAPEHARILAAEGWTEEDVRSYLLYTSFTDDYMKVKAAGYTNRGKRYTAKDAGMSFGVTRFPLTAAPVKDSLISGQDPIGYTFVISSGAHVGGHGWFLPVSSHGLWAAREIGTLAHPPSAMSVFRTEREVHPTREGLLKDTYQYKIPVEGEEPSPYDTAC
ncbi:MAG: hypothetical protein PHF74_05410 [Dehalococcoidales bacterium]|nr:hypothetical protein [Dehalococcoidales bacterium]